MDPDMLSQTRPAPQPAAPWSAVPQPAAPQPQAPVGRLRPAARSRDRWFALGWLLLSILFTHCLLWSSPGIGMGLCFLALFVLQLCYLRKELRRRTLFGLLCGLCLAAGCVCLAWTSDGLIRFLLFFALILLGTLVLRQVMDLRSGEGLRSAVSDLCRLAFVNTFGRFDPTCRALFTRQKRERKKHRAGPLLIGLACAIPALCVVVPLLASSDAAFSGLLQRISLRNLRFDLDTLGEWIVSISLGLGLFLVLFSQAFTVRDEPRPAPSRSGFRGIDATAVGGFLGAISVAYVLYLVSQFAYFAGGFRGLLPENFTVAEYARRGFFEMCCVAAINLVLALLAARLCRRRADGRLPGLIRGLLIFLCLFSLLLNATSLSKMVLYIQRYGLTRLRVLTSVFMVFMTVVLLSAALRQLIKKLPVLKIAVITGAICLLALGFADVDRVVAAYNVRAYQSGALGGIDVQTLTELGDGAVPYLAKLVNDADADVSGTARQELTRRAEERFDITRRDGVWRFRETDPDPLGWTVIGSRADRCLEEIWPKLKP